MKASLRSIRIAPKKATLIAKMIRGMPVRDAGDLLDHMNKKAARIFTELLKSAIANARQNDKQNPADLIIKTIIVNKAQAYHRGVPMARGRMRHMRKFLSHLEMTLGIAGADDAKADKSKKPRTKSSETASKKPRKEVKTPQTPSPKGKSV